MPVVPVQDVEASRAQRLERQKARFRDRGGIFVPSGKNTLVDILLSRTITGESPERALSERDEDDEGVSPLLSKTGAHVKASVKRKHKAADSEGLSVNEDDDEVVVNAPSRKSITTKGRVATEKKSRKVPTKKRATSIKADHEGGKELPAEKTTATYRGNVKTPSDKRARKTSRRAPSPDEENVSAAAPATHAKSKKGTATKRRRVVQSDGEEDGDTKVEKPIRKRMKQTTTIGNGAESNRNRLPKTLDPAKLTSARAKPGKKRQSVQDTEVFTAKTAGRGKKPHVVLAEDSRAEGSEIMFLDPGVAEATASRQEKREEEGGKRSKKGLTKPKPTKGGKVKGGKNAAARIPSILSDSEGESGLAARPHARKKTATMSKVATSQQKSKANPTDFCVSPSIGPLKPKNNEETDTGQPKKKRLHEDTDVRQRKRAKHDGDEDTMHLKPLKIGPPKGIARVDIPSVKQKENVVVPIGSRERNVPSTKAKAVSKLKKPLVQKTRAKGPPKHILQRVHITAGNVPPLLVADSDPDPIDFLS